MNMPGFTAENAIYAATRYHHVAEVSSTRNTAVQPALIRPGCMRNCYKMCISDPNLSDYNDCSQACACTCSGGRGCWQ